MIKFNKQQYKILHGCKRALQRVANDTFDYFINNKIKYEQHASWQAFSFYYCFICF